MQLIDELENRSDSVKLFESIDKVEASYQDNWYLMLDGVGYPITDDAFDALLNVLRIPIKYVQRCVETTEGRFLAEQTLNYWLSVYGDLSFLVVPFVDGFCEAPSITQVFPGKRLYLPGVRVNDLIIEYLNGDVKVQSYVIEDDIFNAVYLTAEKVTIDGEQFTLGVRVLYSDCFNITPRFDGVLFGELGELFCWPTIGRKFRVASNTITQVVEQIEEFLDLSLDGLRETVIPSLESFAERNDKLVDAEKWIARLCSDLRLSKKVRGELVNNCTLYPNHMPGELVSSIAMYTAKQKEDTNIPVGMSRDIQVALSQFIVNGGFK